MGLDMYLSAEKYLSNADYNERGRQQKATGEKVAELINTPFCVKGVEIELAYWCKANQIHNWFVTHCQGGQDNCQKTCISKVQLQKLLDTVNAVLTGHSKAEELLPTRRGFFFGGTDYDESYYGDLEHTKTALEKALTAELDDWDIYYQSSW